MKVAELVSRVRRLLQDAAAYRWDDTTLLDCYNEALLWVVQQRPDANSAVVSFDCEQQSQQDKPAGAYRILGPVANDDTGRVIQTISMDDLTAIDSNWSQTPFGGFGNYVEYMVYDERTPDVFWLYPYPNVSHTVTLQVSREPSTVTDAAANDIEIPLIHLNALKHSMMAFAYLTDGETEGNLMQAQNYLKLAANDLGLKWNIDLMFSRPITGDSNKG
ncbi:DUF6682 family protein [Kistimonas asteriae]|uniref:phage adaptor protein n=1 Tax=Kistimonas asteriae TaxID=517724 RepID=UPI001BADDC51|nr:DUF6682 family protein [Kistimonas asteriae]